MSDLRYLENRLAHLVKKWPENLKEDFSQYIDSKKENSEQNNCGEEVTNQLWFNMITLISKDLLINESDKFLKNLIWAQYCLLLSLRIKDDLLDEDLQTKSLVFVSEQLVLEAILTYKEYFNHHEKFWNYFFNSIERSNLTVMEIDQLELDVNTNPEELLKKYIEVLSLFNIGFFAICSRYKFDGMLSRIIEINNCISIAGQLIDDLEDLEDDLDRNRYNYVSFRLIDEKILKSGTKEDHIKNIELNIIKNGKLSEVFKEINFYTNLSKTYSEDINFKSISELISIYEESISKLQNNYHRQRVNMIFDLFNSVN